jgi:hypothetical protein
MKAPKSFTSLCTPAKLYFVLSVFAIVIALYNRIQLSVVAIKAVFVLFWTCVLSLLCKNGYKSVSWFLVLLPYIIVLLLLFLNLLKRREGMTSSPHLPPASHTASPSPTGSKKIPSNKKEKK